MEEFTLRDENIDGIFSELRGYLDFIGPSEVSEAFCQLVAFAETVSYNSDYLSEDLCSVLIRDLNKLYRFFKENTEYVVEETEVTVTKKIKDLKIKGNHAFDVDEIAFRVFL